ncbi:MAG: MotA/TolQ/ExbB proton channel family protein [Phycisphaerales bacterium]
MATLTQPSEIKRPKPLHGIHVLSGAAALLAVIAWVVRGSGDPAIFIDTNMLLLMVVGIVAAGLWMCFGPARSIGRHHRRGSRLSLRRPRRVQLAIAVLARGYQLAWAGGFAGTLLGLVNMLSNMDDPAAIGPGMAAGLMPGIYALILAEFVFSPLQQVIISRANVPMDAVPWLTLPQRSLLMLCIAGVLMLACTFIICFMGLWPFIETPWPPAL